MQRRRCNRRLNCSGIARRRRSGHSLQWRVRWYLRKAPCSPEQDRMKSRPAHLLTFLVLYFAAAQAQTESKLDYTITLADAAHHRVHVTMSYDSQTGGNEVQLPVWNGLYQVRDFAKNVIGMKASAQSGEPLPL